MSIRTNPQGANRDAAVLEIQIFGDRINCDPHCHILMTDRGFYGKGMFREALPLELKKLEPLFRYNVIWMLIVRGKITH